MDTNSNAITQPTLKKRTEEKEEEVLHRDQATTLQTDGRNERVQQTRQGDCHQPPLQKGWEETNALDDTPD